jgi:type I restriction enzyme S subunit
MSELEQLPIETLPSEWEVRPFGEFCDFMGGTQPPKSTFVYQPTVGYVRLLQIRDFEDDSKATYIPDKGRVRRIGADDISIARYGASVGRILTGKEGAINVAIMTTFPNTSVVDKGFLFFVLQHPNFYRYLTGLGGRAAQAGFNKGEVSRFRFPLPPLPEQKKIAHILSTVQRAIEAQGRIIQTTTELKKSLMHKLFTEGLRNEPQKQTEIGPVPESWEVVELGSLAKVGNGSTPKRANEAYWEGGTVPWLNSTKIHDRFITEAEQFVTPLAVKECHLPKVAPNSLLIAITGQGKTLGNSAITRIETCINQHLAYAQFHSESVDPDFVLWFMQTRYDYLRSIAHGGGSTKGALTCGFLKKVGIPIPSTEEQVEIVSVFETIDKRQADVADKKASLQDLFHTLLHELMTAKTRVQNLSIADRDA